MGFFLQYKSYFCPHYRPIKWGVTKLNSMWWRLKTVWSSKTVKWPLTRSLNCPFWHELLRLNRAQAVPACRILLVGPLLLLAPPPPSSWRESAALFSCPETGAGRHAAPRRRSLPTPLAGGGRVSPTGRRCIEVSGIDKDVFGRIFYDWQAASFCYYSIILYYYYTGGV